jgi:hypothetical protein
VSLLPAIKYHRCRICRRFIIAGVDVTGKQLITGVLELMKIRDKAYSLLSMTPAINLSLVPMTPEIIYQHKVLNISPDISKKFAMAPMRYSGVLGKLIREKT